MSNLEEVPSINEEFRRDVNSENWRGRWMPSRPGEPTPPPKVLPSHYNEGNDSGATSFNIPMGVESNCDNGKVHFYYHFFQ